jgi:hypothetical protein
MDSNYKNLNTVILAQFSCDTGYYNDPWPEEMPLVLGQIYGYRAGNIFWVPLSNFSWLLVGI